MKSAISVHVGSYQEVIYDRPEVSVGGVIDENAELMQSIGLSSYLGHDELTIMSW